MARFVIVLSLVSVLRAFDYNQRCLLFDGMCVSHCPRNMYPYHTKCDGKTMSQRTCASPVVDVIGYTCGWSRCDCIGDLMLDEETHICVEDKDCTPYPSKRPILRQGTERRKTGNPKYHLSKRVKIEENELTELI